MTSATETEIQETKTRTVDRGTEVRAELSNVT
jgi:hypothetical protein